MRRLGRGPWTRGDNKSCIDRVGTSVYKGCEKRSKLLCAQTVHEGSAQRLCAGVKNHGRVVADQCFNLALFLSSKPPCRQERISIYAHLSASHHRCVLVYTLPSSVLYSQPLAPCTAQADHADCSNSSKCSFTRRKLSRAAPRPHQLEKRKETSPVSR